MISAHKLLVFYKIMEANVIEASNTVKLSSDQVIDPNLSQLYPSPDLIEADIGIFRELFDMSFLSCSFTYVCYFFCPNCPTRYSPFALYIT